MSTSPDAAVRFAVLVPVKPPALGKSRLAGLPDEQRTALATAFARDTVAAALAASRVAEVMVVTDDAAFAALAAADGCATLPDGVTGDLNASLVQAALEAGRRWPSYAVAAVCADLPALRAEDLDTALADGAGRRHRLRGGRAAARAPRRTPRGRRRCSTRGSGRARGTPTPAPVPWRSSGDLASLRQDVDDVGDLGRAMVLGVGPHTADAMGHGAG